jgi:hypothetical protein
VVPVPRDLMPLVCAHWVAAGAPLPEVALRAVRWRGRESLRGWSTASYGPCLVLEPNVDELPAAFAKGMRAEYGKVLVSGIPRMTRPRPRKNNAGVTGFSVIDPGGNWIRISAMSANGFRVRQPDLSRLSRGWMPSGSANRPFRTRDA